MEKEGKGHYGQLAIVLSRNLAAISGGIGGGDGDSDDDDDWDMSEDDWSEDEEMGFGLFEEDKVSGVKDTSVAVGRYTAAFQLTDEKKPTIAQNDLNAIFTAQKEVRCNNYLSKVL